MKSFISIPIGILSAFMSLACASETEETVSAAAHTAQVKSIINGVVVGNSGNAYDNVGLAYRNLLSAYKDGNYNPTDYAAIKTIAGALTNDSLPSEAEKPVQEMLAVCMNNPGDALELILNQSNLSLNGRVLLSEFVGDFENLSEEPFSTAYSQIVALENTVSNSTTLSVQDQRVILVVTSITRYSLYHSCCEDTDWRKSVGNIVAALAGAVENNNRAMQYPLITSIAGLEKIHF